MAIVHYDQEIPVCELLLPVLKFLSFKTLHKFADFKYVLFIFKSPLNL